MVTQSPVAGTLVQPNSPVRINLQLTVPELKGLDCEAAKARGRDYGLPDTSCQPQRAGAGDPINRVFEQTPRAQTLLPTAQKLVALAAAGGRQSRRTGLDGDVDDQQLWLGPGSHRVDVG